MGLNERHSLQDAISERAVEAGWMPPLRVLRASPSPLTSAATPTPPLPLRTALLRRLEISADRRIGGAILHANNISHLAGEAWVFRVGQGGACAAGGAEIRGSEPACAGLDGLKSRSLWLRHVHEAKRSATQTPATKPHFKKDHMSAQPGLRFCINAVMPSMPSGPWAA